MSDSTAETIRKLTQLEMKLLKAFIREADPDNWTGRGYDLKDIGEKQKGLRILDKTNAKNTYAVLKNVTEKRKDLTAPMTKDGKTIATKDEDAIEALNAQAAKHYGHLQSIN